MVKRIFMLICSVLLCVTVSFAWIITKNQVNTKTFMLNYSDGTLIISDKNVKASLWMRDNSKDSNMIEISNSEEDNKGDRFIVENVVPGTSIHFTIRLRNTAKEEIPVDISISRLCCDANLIDDSESPKVSIELSNVTYNNYPISRDPGAKSYMLIQDTMTKIEEDVYAVPLYSGLYVPPTGDGWIEIRGRFVFSGNMDNTYQAKLFRVDSFKVVE